MAMDDLIAAAKLRQNDGVLRRWSHYECLKDQLRQMDLLPEEYQYATREKVTRRPPEEET